MIVEICSAVIFASTLLFVYFGFFWKFNWINHTGKIAAKKNKTSHEIGQLPPVYPNGWFALLESSALKKGQVKLVFALGQNYAVFRMTTGKVRIAEACCTHLRANILTKDKGNDVLECPLHNHRFYEHTGEYTDSPYSKNIPSTVQTKIRDSMECNGFIFVWYHAESISPYWWPQPVDNISNGTWIYQGRSEDYANCHIQEIPENGADAAHLNAVHGPFVIAKDVFSKFVHHSWLNVSWQTCSSISQDLPHEGDNTDSTKAARYHDQTNKHIAISTIKQKTVFFEKFSAFQINAKAVQLGPGYVELLLQTASGPMCIIMSVTPVQPLLQRIVHLMFAPMLLSLHAKIAMIGHSIMFKRDLVIWNHKIYLKNPMFVNSDKAIMRFRKWYKQFYSESSPTFESCKNSSNTVF